MSQLVMAAAVEIQKQSTKKQGRKQTTPVPEITTNKQKCNPTPMKWKEGIKEGQTIERKEGRKKEKKERKKERNEKKMKNN